MSGKKISFGNATVLGTEKVIPCIEEQPVPLPKSKSTNGLSSLTKSIIEHETKQNEMNDILENMREVVKKYQDELVNLKAMLQAQTEIIKSQEDCLSEYEEELKKTKEEIKLIWET